MIMLAWLVLPLEQFSAMLKWVESRGIQGAFLIGVVYALSTVALIPGSLLTLGIGAVYGPWLGFAIVSPASVVGATIAFLLGRSVFSGAVEKKMAGNRKFHAIRGAIEEGGLKVLFLVRLSPVFPFTIVNYAFGLARLKVSTYILGSFFGMLPGTFMYVYLGSIAGDLASIRSGGIDQEEPSLQVMKWVGLVATVLVTWVVTKRAKQSLSEGISEEI
jgi:uncharacterized membrane protein YdjX (TVP38/TMEM64 family)